MRIFILGYMGSGKSTLGPKLAEALGIPFHDLDDVFETRFKISINDFFQKYGEKYFRVIEHNLLIEMAQMEEFVIATGGGTPCHHGNMEFMKQKGITLYVKLPFDMLIQRLALSQRKRPILTTFNVESPDIQIREHLEQREVFYNTSHLIMDGSNFDPEEAADLIRQKALHLDDA
jgi:shikimate kinase